MDTNKKNGLSSSYIIEHQVSSEYHKVGEKQQILANYVEIGRDSSCEIRFDESFTTVSRHHAAIKKDGDKWKIIQLSQKNSTFLNGKPLQKEWFLQNGDEIQLALNGPKLIFRFGEADKKSSIHLTARLDEFSKKQVKPYQNALIVSIVIIILIIAACIIGGMYIQHQHDELEESRVLIERMYQDLEETNEKLREAALQVESANKEVIDAKDKAYKARMAALKAQKANEETERKMQQLRDEMNSFYNGIINGENQ